jgi:hypothetical protein
VREESDVRDSWASYERKEVEVAGPNGGSLRICSAPAPDRGIWPWPTGETVHILTAWDPGTERPGRALNRRRQAALEADLRLLGSPLLAASGVDPATGGRDEGVAVLGASESAILALGARYGQEAVFAWTPAEWAIVACEGGRRLVSGWSLVDPQPGFPYRTR